MTRAWRIAADYGCRGLCGGARSVVCCGWCVACSSCGGVTLKLPVCVFVAVAGAFVGGGMQSVGVGRLRAVSVSVAGCCVPVPCRLCCDVGGDLSLVVRGGVSRRAGLLDGSVASGCRRSPVVGVQPALEMCTLIAFLFRVGSRSVLMESLCEIWKKAHPIAGADA